VDLESEIGTALCGVCGQDFPVPGIGRKRVPIKLECPSCLEARRRQEEAKRDCLRQEQEARQKELAEAQERQRAEQREAALAAVRADLPAALARCGVPLHWQTASFDGCIDLPDELVRAARAWAGEPRGMVLFFGAPGSGKTYLGTSMLRAMLEGGLYMELTPSGAFDLRCRYACERDFLAALRADFDGGRSYARDVQDMPLLVFDDLGSSRLTDWGRGEVAGLLEDRHAHELPTVITSNLSPDELAVAVDPRVSSRIVESKLVFRFPPRDLRIKGTIACEQPQPGAGLSSAVGYLKRDAE